MPAMAEGANTLKPSYFRTRTASVSLKVDIHPPRGININHVEGESTHSTIIKQGEEILHFTVFKELEQDGLKIPADSLLYQNLLCTSKGFVLLRWEKLCKTMYAHMTNNRPSSPLTHFITKKCHCKRRIRPTGCNGFLCLVLEHISAEESFPQKITKLLFHTVCACRWSLRQNDASLLDKVLKDSLNAMDSICSEHDSNCQGGWECIAPLHKRTSSTGTSLSSNLTKQSLVLAFVTAGMLTASFFIAKIIIWGKNRCRRWVNTLHTRANMI